MTIVDLNSTKTIEFGIKDVHIIKNAELVILLPDQVELRFQADIQKNKNEIHIHLPILSDKIKEKTVANYFLEIEDLNGKFHKVKEDKILFQYSSIISLKFHDQYISPQVKLNEQNEVVLETKIGNPNVKYNKAPSKIPRRTEILVS